MTSNLLSWADNSFATALAVKCSFSFLLYSRSAPRTGLCSTSLKYVGYSDVASSSLCKSSCKHIISNPPKMIFEARRARLVPPYQYFTIKLSVWQQVSQQATGENMLRVELKGGLHVKIRCTMVSERQAERIRNISENRQVHISDM